MFISNFFDCDICFHNLGLLNYNIDDEADEEECKNTTTICNEFCNDFKAFDANVENYKEEDDTK